MGFVKQWTVLICISSIICVIAELILPPGKMEKVMNMVLSVFMLCAIVSPFSKNIITLKPKIKSEKEFLNKNKVSRLTENIDEQIKKALNSNIKLIISNFLKDINASAEKIEIFMDTNEDNCISIIKCKIFINKDSENLRDKIISTIKNNLGIETEVVIK